MKIAIAIPMSGRCQCNEIQYEISTRPKAVYACHCTECQRQTSASFGLSMPVDRHGFKLLRGVPRIWERASASGRRVACASCPTCGTRIYHAPERNPSIYNVKPGTLDDTRWIEPVAHLWTASAQSWVPIPAHVISYATQPDSFDRIFEAWNDRYA